MIFALMLVSGFIAVSCDNEPMDGRINPLIGTWEDTWVDDDGDPGKDRFIFSANNEVTKILESFLITSTYGHTAKEPLNVTETGTYQYDNSVINFIWESSNYIPDGYVAEFPIENHANYSIKGNKLTLTFSWNKQTYTYQKVK